MNQPHAFQELNSKHCILWISPNSTMAEIERFTGLVGVFNAQGGVDPLRFTLTPKKGLKARLLYHCNVTMIRPLPHPRFSHPTTGKRLIRLSEAISIARILSGIRPGDKLTSKAVRYAEPQRQVIGAAIPS